MCFRWSAFACLFFNSICSYQSFADGNTAGALDDISSRLIENKSKLYSWIGTAHLRRTDDRGRQHFCIDFGADSVRDIQYFATEPEGKKEKGKWFCGFFRDGATFYTQGDDMTRNVRVSNINRHRVLGLSPAAFDPMAVFDPMDHDAKKLFARMLENQVKSWCRLGVREEGDLRIVSYGNNSIGVADTVITFDLSRGGAVVSCINPAPGNERVELKVQYELISDIWLPKRVTKEEFAGNKLRKKDEFVFENHSVNRPLSDEELQPDKVLHLEDGVWLKDEINGSVGRFVDLEDQGMALEISGDNADDWVAPKGVKLSLILVGLVVFGATWLVGPKQVVARKSMLTLGSLGVLAGLLLTFGANKYFEKPDANANLALCGHWSSLKVARSLGEDVQMSQVQDKLRYSSGGNSLDEIRKALESFGLEVEGRHLEWDEIDATQLPCVARLVNPNHFVVLVASANDRGISVLDGTESRGSYTLHSIRKRWDGSVLTVSRPFNATRAVSADALYKDIGLASSFGNKPIHFQIRNDLESAMKIESVHTDCSCLSSKYSEEPVEGGQSCSIDLRFDFNKKKSANGEFKNSAIVEYLQDGESHFMELEVGGCLETEYFTKAKVASFGAVEEGTVAEVVVPVFFEKEPDLALLPSVSVLGTDLIEAEWEDHVQPTNKKVVLLKLAIDAVKSQPAHESLKAIARIESQRQPDFVQDIKLVGSLVSRVQVFPRHLAESSTTNQVTLVSHEQFSLLADESKQAVESRQDGGGLQLLTYTLASDFSKNPIVKCELATGERIEIPISIGR
ncbi:MAG: cysteine peptidase family C39 domain-containing protein [Planctomycetota bacterium]